jgi:predicted lipoprotein with Yx(FWY)xxD motif
MRRYVMRRSALAVLVAVGVALAAAACGGSGNQASPAPAAAPGTIQTAGSDLGTILVDAQGMTLYLFQRDGNGSSSCTGACAQTWPPAAVSGAPAAAGEAAANDLGTITRPDGTTQATYGGHPLYTYSGDAKAGDTNGEGIDNTWYAVSPAGKAVEKKGGGYGGY